MEDRKELAQDLNPVYTAATAEEAENNLQDFAKKWDDKYPTISKSWHAHWANIIPFFDYPHDIRKVIYTTNAIESLKALLNK